MNIPTLMTILGARGAGTPSAVAGAELPGAGETGFACLVQMLLDQQRAPGEASTANGPAADAPAGAAGTSRPVAEALGAEALGAEAPGAEAPGAEASGAEAPGAGLRAEGPAPDARASGVRVLDAAASDAPGAARPAEQVPGQGDVTVTPDTVTGPGAGPGPTEAPPATPADAVPTQVANGASAGLAATQAAAAAGIPVQVAPDGRGAAPAAVSSAPGQDTTQATTTRPAGPGRGRVAADQAAAGLPLARTGEPVATSTTAVSGNAASTTADPAVPGARGAAHEPAVPTAGDPAAEAVPVGPVTNGGAQDPAVSAETGRPSVETGPVATQQNTVTTTAVTAVSAPAHTSGPVAPQAGHAEAAGPVGGQVFPEVARLVTRGDGTQRLTLRLSPENLGEVRIVVTVRGGAVDVSLAAGMEAQEALRHGSGALRRLLESVGAASTQIVVRDLPAGTSTGQAATQPSGTGTAATYADGGAPGREQRRGGADPDSRAADGRRHPGAGTHPTANPAPASAAGVDLRL